MPYDVENAGGALKLKIRNPVGPFVLLMKSDGSLAGSGTVNVAGRVVTGSNGDNITYAPRNASCLAGTLALKSDK